jgi:tRNA (guanine37-N1)-methyltransferase
MVTVQRAAFAPLQRDNPGVDVAELVEGVADVRAWADEGRTLVAVSAGRLVGFARGKAREGRWRIARLAVAPDLQGRGLGARLLAEIEGSAPEGTSGFEVMTGAGSTGTRRFYKRAGYRLRRETEPGVVRLTKQR